jgi:uncharacterized protein YndB with AHSA1/START domain
VTMSLHGGAAPTATIERMFRAPVERVWAMWTTKEGLEAWYWPPPLVAKVIHLDVRTGGRYEIAAVGLPHTSRGVYTEVVQNRRLASRAMIDFVPDTAPYERTDVVEFHAVGDGTRMVFTFSRMHSDMWQELATKGWNGSLDKLAAALET